MKKRKMTKTKKRILEELRKNPNVSYWQLSIILDLHTRTIEKHMRYLKHRGYVRRVGPNHRGKANGRWEVLK